MTWRRRLRLSTLLFYGWVIVYVIVSVSPLYWAINTSLKTHAEIIAWPPTWFPHTPTWENYRATFTEHEFGRNILNSVIVAGGTTVLALFLGALCAYALARLRFPGKLAVLGLILMTSMFPSIAIVSPLFILLRKLQWLNTFQGLIVPYTSFALPLTIWILTSFFHEIPYELEEAALVDGATPFQALRLVILPLAAPGLVTAGLLVFIAAWNEFLFALNFTLDNSTRTVPVAIALFSRQFEVPWGELNAASVVVTLPLVLLVLLFQRRIIAGLTAGAIKG
ncbi:MAG: carbohydrate ABC transporter permease [Chloroflexi bacterium]|nr:MAG: carbohydrate ABC transporter permease [Chloroflexota bacterium]